MIGFILKPRLYAQVAPCCKFTPGCKIAPWSKFATPYVAFICQYIVFICYWICSLNISQMFQFYFKEKFDVLRMFRLLVSSKTVVWEKCNFIWFYLLYSFMQNLKRIIHQSFVSTAPTYGDSHGIAGVRCWTITFWLSPQCRGSVGL